VAVFWVSSGLFQQHVYFYPKPEIYEDDQDGHFFYNHPERGAYSAA